MFLSVCLNCVLTAPNPLVILHLASLDKSPLANVGITVSYCFNKCVQCSLLFRLASHSLPIVIGQFTGANRNRYAHAAVVFLLPMSFA